jgi:hypothetical protein
MNRISIKDEDENQDKGYVIMNVAREEREDRKVQIRGKEIKKQHKI